ncbi:MAG: hypothetical protein K6A41_07150 [Bacteroidales bacterium]|nr:hypothetical protein [Bacteroidales bacterium]
MKKLLFVCFLAMASMTLFGQSYQVLRENIVKAPLASYMTTGQLESADGHTYLFYTDNTVWSASKPVDDIIFSIDRKSNKVSEMYLQHLNSYEFINMYEDEKNLYALFSLWENKTKTYTLFLNTIAKNQSPAKWNPEPVFTITTEKRDGLYLYHGVSPDNSKMAFCVLAATKKNDFKGSVAMAFGDGGEKLWENDVDFDFSNKTFSIIDFVVDNDAVAYTAVSSYTNATRSSRDDEALHIITISSDNTRSVDERIDFGYVTSGKMKLTSNGNLVVGGYYCENFKENEAGYFMGVLNLQNEGFIIDKAEFPSDYYAGKAMLGIPAPDKHATTAQYIEEYPDGKLLLLGEMRATVIIRDSKGMTSYKYYARNIPVVYADETGKLIDFALIKKNQMAGSGVPQKTLSLRAQGFSYVPLMHNGKVYLFFCDAMENYLGKSGMLSKPSFAPAHATAYCAIVPGQPIETKAILNGKTDKYRMIIPLSMGDDYVVGIGTNKKKMGEIVKVNYAF